MSPRAAALAAGLTGGLIELRLAFTGAALVGQLFWPVIALVALWRLEDLTVAATSLHLGPLVLPGLLGMFVAFGTVLTAQYLPSDREDGTLLRALATPHGIAGHLAGRLFTASATVLAYLVMIAVPGLLIVKGLTLQDLSWTRLAWVLGLGLLASQLLGAALGSLVPTPRATGYVSLPIMALTAVSGIFYPITALPGWAQAVGQAFPIYWLGLGMRSAMLPDNAAIAELSGTWRPGTTAAVLAAWTLAGLVAAPLVLRRMALRGSGARLAERHDKLPGQDV